MKSRVTLRQVFVFFKFFQVVDTDLHELAALV